MAAALQASSCVYAGLLGLLLVRWYGAARQRRAQRERVRMGFLASSGADPSALAVACHGLAARLIGFLRSRTLVVNMKPHLGIFHHRVWALGSRGFDRTLPLTGLAPAVTKAGCIDARAWACLAVAAAGALVGAVFSLELAALAGCVGGVVGWKLPLWALHQERDTRRNDLEGHLSEMLEVVSLGLRSGLSFDGSFALYHQHFSNALGRNSASTQQLWQLGLASREGALRALAASYDSQMFSRVVENIVRSLRFGSSLADELEASAVESRMAHKAVLEEKVAKAPVKMLVPTAALILPAMLLLVLGPVLLQMMQGF
ncbi:MAG: type II secretion system F family protein [Micrococcales bacterium]|nr:type II secretion system F family protein [Micrococcales bacterium]